MALGPKMGLSQITFDLRGVVAARHPKP